MSLIIDMLIALEFDLLCINNVNLPEKYHLTRGTTTQTLPIMNNSTMEIQCSEYRDKKVTKIVHTFNKCNVM